MPKRKIDIIIVAASIDDNLKRITQDAINTCHKSEGNIDFNIIVIETSNRKVTYRDATVKYFIRDEFNYNLALNYGLKFCKYKYIALCNNDIIFEKGWASILIKQMKKHDALSACPYDPELKRKGEEISKGYSIRIHLVGWCIFVDREVFKLIGHLNEEVDFWYSDNIYADQLKKAKIKHIMVYDSIVHHIENQTLNTCTNKQKSKIMHSQARKYAEAKEKLMNEYKFSIILPCTLLPYPGAAKDRPNKLRRAIKSVIKQTYKDWELIIIADGCDQTVGIYHEFAKDKRIKCFLIEKQPTWAGVVRQKGIENAHGKYIIYLDSDDYYGKDHLLNIESQLRNYDWVYFNDYLQTHVKTFERDVKLSYGVCGTCAICHKKELPVTWNGLDRYGHDWYFIEQLMKYTNYKKIEKAEYYVCHQPNVFDT